MQSDTMDRKDFLITTSETFEAIELRLDMLAVNYVDVLTEDSSMLLIVDGCAKTRLSADQNSCKIVATVENNMTLFAYHEIEECWFAEDSHVELLAWLGRHISSLLNETVDLSED
jgi:hypothetical protein